MPRDLNGNYTLPGGNPVVSGTVIDSDWANPTLEDIAVALTDSLSRSGKGGMIAPFKLLDGLVNSPALQFINDPDTGLYRVGDDQMGLVAGGQEAARLTTTLIRFLKLATMENGASIFNDKGMEFRPASQVAGDTGAFRLIEGADDVLRLQIATAPSAWTDVMVFTPDGTTAISRAEAFLLENQDYFFFENNSGDLGSGAFRMGSQGANLVFEINTGTLGVPVWSSVFEITPAGVILSALPSLTVLAYGSSPTNNQGLYFSSDDEVGTVAEGAVRFRNADRGEVVGSFRIERYRAGAWEIVVSMPNGPDTGRPRIVNSDLDDPACILTYQELLDYQFDSRIQGAGANFGQGIGYRIIGDPTIPGNPAVLMQWGVDITDINGDINLVFPIPFTNGGGAQGIWADTRFGSMGPPESKTLETYNITATGMDIEAYEMNAGINNTIVPAANQIVCWFAMGPLVTP